MTKSVMVVDDDLDILSILTYIFESRGYRVRQAHNGAEALQLVERFIPDLFILDIAMPEMDGLDLCKRLRGQARTRNVPVLFLTARDQPEVVVEAFQAGGNDYVAKPFNTQELMARVENLLRRVGEVAPPERVREGQVVAVTSARGGVGKTTLAVNLALGLARMWTDEVLLVDASLEFGRTAVLLDVTDPRDLMPLLHERVPDLERDYLEETYMNVHPSGLRFLASPLSPADVESIGPPEIEHLLDMLRPAYGTIVFDMASSAREPYRSILRLSDQIVVVVNPEVSTLVATQALLQTLSMLDILPEVIQVVLNDFPRVENSPQQNEIEAFLGTPLASVFPPNTLQLSAAANTGHPVILEPEPTPFNEAVIQAAYYLTTRLRMPG